MLATSLFNAAEKLYGATSSGSFFSVELSSPTTTCSLIKTGNPSPQLSFSADFSTLFAQSYETGNGPRLIPPQESFPPFRDLLLLPAAVSATSVVPALCRSRHQLRCPLPEPPSACSGQGVYEHGSGRLALSPDLVPAQRCAVEGAQLLHGFAGLAVGTHP